MNDNEYSFPTWVCRHLDQQRMFTSWAWKYCILYSAWDLELFCSFHRTGKQSTENIYVRISIIIVFCSLRAPPKLHQLFQFHRDKEQ